MPRRTHGGQPRWVSLPAFYELHAWAWQDNPSGKFSDWNPSASCTPLPDLAAAPAAQATQHPWTVIVLAAAALVASVAAVRIFGAQKRTAP